MWPIPGIVTQEFVCTVFFMVPRLSIDFELCERLNGSPVLPMIDVEALLVRLAFPLSLGRPPASSEHELNVARGHPQLALVRVTSMIVGARNFEVARVLACSASMIVERAD